MEENLFRRQDVISCVKGECDGTPELKSSGKLQAKVKENLIVEHYRT